MSDTGKLIGKIIEGPAEKDAIHVAVAPVEAGNNLVPGEPVKLNEQGMAVSCDYDKDFIGVADPFVKARYIRKGERFWLFLNPGSITSLRHSWSHPAFDEATEPSPAPQDPKVEAVKRIEEIAEVMDLTYNQLMRGAESWVYSEDYMTEQGSEHWRDTFPAYEEEFWRLYEIVTGETVPNNKKQSFFSCSC